MSLLIKHMRDNYSDTELRNDLDCVLSLCAAEKDRAAVREFTRAKLAGKAYRGYGLNLSGKVCESCHNPFTARRSDARFCSAKCRVKAASRAA